MRVIIDRTRCETISMMHAIRTDSKSWEEWWCLKIETIPLPERELQAVQANVILVLQSAFPGDSGTAFLGGDDEILVFCKHSSAALLAELGRQVQELVFSSCGELSNFQVFDLNTDTERLADSYSWGDLAHSSASGFLPDEAIFPREADVAEYRPGSRKVLLVEDDPVTRWMVRTALKDECCLATAHDAGKAISAYQTFRPDMVLLDINLPDRDGRAVMESIRHNDPGAWIVMFSSNDSPENISRSIEGGARGFIAKPFTREKILRYLHECPMAH